MESAYLFYFNFLNSSHNGILSVTQRGHLRAFNSKFPYSLSVLQLSHGWLLSLSVSQLKSYLLRKVFIDSSIKSMSQGSCKLFSRNRQGALHSFITYFQCNRFVLPFYFLPPSLDYELHGVRDKNPIHSKLNSQHLAQDLAYNIY